MVLQRIFTPPEKKPSKNKQSSWLPVDCITKFLFFAFLLVSIGFSPLEGA